MKITIWKHGANLANYYPACNYLGVSQREMSRNIRVSQGAIKSPPLCSLQQQSYPRATYWRQSLRKKIVPFYTSWGRRVSSQLSGFKLIRRTGCPVAVCMVHGRLIEAGYRPRFPDRRPKLTPDHRCCCRMLVHRPPQLKPSALVSCAICWWASTTVTGMRELFVMLLKG